MFVFKLHGWLYTQIVSFTVHFFQMFSLDSRRRRRFELIFCIHTLGSRVYPFTIPGDGDVSGLYVGAVIEQPKDGTVIQITQTMCPARGTVDGTVKDDMVCALFLRATLAGRRRHHSPSVHSGAEKSDAGT